MAVEPVWPAVNRIPARSDSLLGACSCAAAAALAVVGDLLLPALQLLAGSVCPCRTTVQQSSFSGDFEAVRLRRSHVSSRVLRVELAPVAAAAALAVVEGLLLPAP